VLVGGVVLALEVQTELELGEDEYVTLGAV
jgi:hypothetical protein